MVFFLVQKGLNFSSFKRDCGLVYKISFVKSIIFMTKENILLVFPFIGYKSFPSAL
jgi:hypothetical protein